VGELVGVLLYNVLEIIVRIIVIYCIGKYRCGVMCSIRKRCVVEK